MKQKRSLKLMISALTAAVAMAILPTLPAAAEGTVTSWVEQVRPSFLSRAWTDANTDSASTKITLTSCKVNVGGGSPGSTSLSSVGIRLWHDSSAVSTITKPCGTYDFGRQGTGKYYFEIYSINGSTGTIFLNADVTWEY